MNSEEGCEGKEGGRAEAEGEAGGVGEEVQLEEAKEEEPEGVEHFDKEVPPETNVGG